jgi:NADP-dependent 3-hydroxy acid dehydrogenase YdfG
MPADYYANSVGVVTGAGAGIGRALALQLAGRGGRLALWDRDNDAVAATAATCREAGARVRVDVVDVTDSAAVLERALAVHAEFGRVNLVFCVAGVIHTGSVLDTDLADFQHVVDVNLWGVVHTVKAFLPLVISSGGGHIVTVSSAFGLMAAPRYSAYVTSKFAVRGFTETLRQEMVIDGHPVKVSCAYPGGVRTQIVRNGRFAAGEDAAAVADRFDRQLARTTPEEAATTILRGTQRGQGQILVGADARGVSCFVRATGAGYQRILPQIFRRSGAARQTHQDKA